MTTNAATSPWWVVDYVLRVEVTEEQLWTLTRVLATSYSSDRVITETALGHSLIRMWTRAENEETALAWGRRAVDVVFPNVEIVKGCTARVEHPGDNPPVARN